MKPDPDRIRKWGELATIGPLLAASVILGWWIGSWADGKLGTEPWGLVAGVVLGTAAGFVQMVKLLNRVGEPGGAARKARPKGKDGDGLK